MAERVTITYDVEGDILHIDLRPRYAGQESDFIADDVLAQMNPDTGAVEGLEIFSFSTHFPTLRDRMELPISGQFSAPVEEYDAPELPRAANR